MSSQPILAEAPHKSAVARVIGVFLSPKETFADIGARPSFILPLCISIVLSIIMVTVIGQKITWERIVEQGIEKSKSSQQLSAEQKQQQIAMGAKFAPVMGYIGGTVGVVIMAVIVAAVLMGCMAMFGGRFTFKQSFGIVAHSWLIGIITTVLSIIVIYAKNGEDIDIQNPLVFNGAAFLSPESAAWLKSLLGSFDVFSFWMIALLAIGFSAASGGRLKVGKAAAAVILPWAIWVIGKTGWAAMFS